MIKKLLLASAVGAIFVFGNSSAQENQAASTLANQSGCLNCHKVDQKLIGPSYQSVAERYKDQSNAPSILTQKVKNGGVGVWGRIPMPPHPQLSDENVAILVAWVLRGAPTN